LRLPIPPRGQLKNITGRFRLTPPLLNTATP
jgi:hypothetical protein